MYSKSLTILAAAVVLANQAQALGAHRHAHQQVHQNAQRALKTETVTIVDWVTVTIDDDGSTVVPSTSSEFTRHTSPVSELTTSTPDAEPTTVKPTTIAPSTTLVTSVKPTTTPGRVDTPTVSSTPPPATTPVTPPASSGGKRGLVYNHPELLPGFVGAGSKVSWGYNWDQKNNMGLDLEFVPMLWSSSDDHTKSWSTNANAAIAAGSKCLLSFNEPDNAGQADMTPQVAADKHIQYMNPFKGKARIGAPAITNSGAATQGVGWLKSFFTACGGNCAVDFIPMHWYATANSVNYFFSHLLEVHAVRPDLPVWITEFAPSGTQDEINTFLKTVMQRLDTDPQFAFVERYSYFMVSVGRLMSSNTDMSPLGKTFAYA